LADYLFTHPPKAFCWFVREPVKNLVWEDAIAAGALVTRLSDDQRLSDSAMITRSLYEQVGDNAGRMAQTDAKRQAVAEDRQRPGHHLVRTLSVFDLVVQLKGEEVIGSTECGA